MTTHKPTTMTTHKPTTMTPVRLEDVNICDTTITAAVGPDGTVYASPKHICDGLGISWTTQYRKLLEDKVFSSVMLTMSTTARDGKRYQTLMLPRDHIHGWLFTIRRANTPGAQARLDAFRHECVRALDAWFNGGLRHGQGQEAPPKRTFAIPQTFADALLLAGRKCSEMS